MGRLPDNALDLMEINNRVEQRSPYVLVLLQECERMNQLISTIKISLKELMMGLLGQLTISEAMDAVIKSLYLDKVPGSWTKFAYASLKPLGLWFTDLLDRVRFLQVCALWFHLSLSLSSHARTFNEQDWAADLNLPKSVWIGGLFNPMSFLTAILQTTARRQEWPLDKVFSHVCIVTTLCLTVYAIQMVLQTEVLKKEPSEIGAAPRDGAYIHGLFLQGARWDKGASSLRDATLKELFPVLPVMWVKAVTSDKKETKGVYECPVYVTSLRGATYVFMATLRTSEKPMKWILAGTCLLLSND